ncbi:MAG: DUF4234 domain-containing protein [Deltaproteobacteria bacterium]|nr:DUF4234 domain-containing protein [Deltaproteobacteria bacterium]
MTRRSPITVVVLSLVTFGLYALYWLYVTTEELSQETGRGDLSPTMDVLLAVCTFGLWGMYATYRNAGLAHEELAAAGISREDKSLIVGVALVATFFSGWAWLVAVAILQEELNALADTVAAPSAPLALPTAGIPMPVSY